MNATYSTVFIDALYCFWYINSISFSGSASKLKPCRCVILNIWHEYNGYVVKLCDSFVSNNELYLLICTFFKIDCRLSLFET